jgi:hypothetical protein
MKRLVILTAGVAFLLSAGCTQDWLENKSLLPDQRGVPGTKDAVKVPPASLAVAERVELVGRKIIAQNTFTGIEPMFMTIGVPENVLFHRGSEQLFISQGLVEKCKTDAELAAVLCAEMGQMVAENRSAKAVGRDVDPIPDSHFGGSAQLPGGTAFDAGREAELAYHQKLHPRGASNTVAESADTARELLKGAGYSPAELDRVEALLKQSDRGEKIKKQMSASAPAPKWEK